MTTPEISRQEIRRILERATPEQLRRLLDDIRKAGDDGRDAA